MTKLLNVSHVTQTYCRANIYNWDGVLNREIASSFWNENGYELGKPMEASSKAHYWLHTSVQLVGLLRILSVTPAKLWWPQCSAEVQTEQCLGPQKKKIELKLTCLFRRATPNQFLILFHNFTLDLKMTKGLHPTLHSRKTTGIKQPRESISISPS